MRELLRFFWNSTRGHRLAPWRSPYLRRRMETYSGLQMDKIGFVEISANQGAIQRLAGKEREGVVAAQLDAR
jgi:hypothetical protein